MNPGEIFHKTASGQAEIAAKTGALDIKQRRVLILVNGENSVATLAQIALCDNLDEILEGLLEQGFITLPGAGAADSAPPAGGVSARGEADASPARIEVDPAGPTRTGNDVAEQDSTRTEIDLTERDLTQTEIDVTERDLTRTEIDVTEID